MKLSFNLTCNCGNTKDYSIEEKYHSESHDTFIDLTYGINDDRFQAEAIPDGMVVNCRKCGKETEVI